MTATRYYTFGGSTVAVRTGVDELALMLGDEQGSTNVVMPVTIQTSGALEKATLADAALVTRTSYTPYGQLRGEDNTAVDRGWLGQVEDRVDGTGASSTGTGLTYLNARYYDPATSRFISPDPLMNPGDPKTLDPYRYADNNPVVFTDASGLSPCAGTGANESRCLAAYYKGTGYKAPSKPFTAKFAKGVVKRGLPPVWLTPSSAREGGPFLRPRRSFNGLAAGSPGQRIPTKQEPKFDPDSPRDPFGGPSKVPGPGFFRRGNRDVAHVTPRHTRRVAPGTGTCDGSHPQL